MCFILLIGKFFNRASLVSGDMEVVVEARYSCCWFLSVFSVEIWYLVSYTYILILTNILFFHMLSAEVSIA